jgi:hypothetical protein
MIGPPGPGSFFGPWRQELQSWLPPKNVPDPLNHLGPGSFFGSWRQELQSTFTPKHVPDPLNHRTTMGDL